MPITAIFIGPQGCGKGTQVAKLIETLECTDTYNRIVDIQTGRRFRAMAIKQETYAEKKVAKTLDSGQLQPAFLTNFLWVQAMLEQLDDKSHLLIDGFPRTLSQALVLAEALEFFQRKDIQVINLEIDEQTVRERMKARARADDTDESIEVRLSAYRTNTLPVLDFYREQGNANVHDIDATNSIDEVHAHILGALAFG